MGGPCGTTSERSFAFGASGSHRHNTKLAPRVRKTSWRVVEGLAMVALGIPSRHNSFRLHRTKNPGAAMKEISGTLRTIIQGPGSSSAVAA